MVPLQVPHTFTDANGEEGQANHDEIVGFTVLRHGPRRFVEPSCPGTGRCREASSQTETLSSNLRRGRPRGRDCEQS